MMNNKGRIPRVQAASGLISCDWQDIGLCPTVKESIHDQLLHRPDSGDEDNGRWHRQVGGQLPLLRPEVIDQG